MIEPLFDSYWLERFAKANRLFVGFSGGLDSTVLLHHLTHYPSLANKLMAVHVNHQLSKNAMVWQTHCKEFCNHWKIPLLIEQIELKKKTNIEEEARKARYGIFAKHITNNDCLLLGHHLNDQAETLLLHLFRGTGVDGLAAMALEKNFAKGYLLRPLLLHPRNLLEKYAHFHQLAWIEDESNQDISFTRNYLRHQTIPLLQQRWPALINHLGLTALHCHEAQTNLESLAELDCPALKTITNRLPMAGLSHLSLVRVKNVLRVWIKKNQVKLPNASTFKRLIQEVWQATDDATPYVAWGKVGVKRYQKILYLLPQKKEVTALSQLIEWTFFPNKLDLSNNGGGYLYANKVERGLFIPEKTKITLRYREGGELFQWHGQKKRLKKLFQEWQIPPWMREQIPLIYINDELACIVGYAISDNFYKDPDQEEALPANNCYVIQWGPNIQDD